MDHNKPYDRIDRVNNQILDILGDILIKHIDLRHLGFVTFTKIDVSRDLRLARVYYSVLNQKFYLGIYSDDCLLEFKNIPTLKNITKETKN